MYIFQIVIIRNVARDFMSDISFSYCFSNFFRFTLKIIQAKEEITVFSNIEYAVGKKIG